MPASSLLSRLQKLIETTYDWSTGIEDIGAFVVGDEGYRRIYGGKEILEEIPGRYWGARTLVTWEDGQVRARVYYPDRLVGLLEWRNPLQRLDEVNVFPFAVLVEELDHLLMLAWCFRFGRQVRLVELEFHADVTQYLVLSHFLGRLTERTLLSRAQREWVLERVFRGVGEDLSPSLRERYRTAAHLARQTIARLETLPGPERIRYLRQFARVGWDGHWRSQKPDSGWGGEEEIYS